MPHGNATAIIITRPFYVTLTSLLTDGNESKLKRNIKDNPPPPRLPPFHPIINPSPHNSLTPSQIPGVEKPVACGQFPNCAGSPPILTYTPTAGTPPSSTKN